MLDYKSLKLTVEALRETSPKLYVEYSLELHKIEAMKDISHQLKEIDLGIRDIR